MCFCTCATAYTHNNNKRERARSLSAKPPRSSTWHDCLKWVRVWQNPPKFNQYVCLIGSESYRDSESESAGDRDRETEVQWSMWLYVCGVFTRVRESVLSVHPIDSSVRLSVHFLCLFCWSPSRYWLQYISVLYFLDYILTDCRLFTVAITLNYAYAISPSLFLFTCLPPQSHTHTMLPV